MPTLAARATDPATHWQAVTVADWYGKGGRTIELTDETAVWYHSGLPPVPIRWVLIRDPQERFATQALLCTDRTVIPQQIIAWFVRRWQMESNLRGSTAASRHRNAAAMDGQGNPPHDARAARPLLAGDSARASAPEEGIRRYPAGGVVPQTSADLRGRVRLGATGDLGA